MRALVLVNSCGNRTSSPILMALQAKGSSGSHSKRFQTIEMANVHPFRIEQKHAIAEIGARSLEMEPRLHVES